MFFNRTDTSIVDIGFDDFRTVTPLYEPRVLPHHTLHYVLEGRGTLTIGDKEYTVSPGWVFVLPAGISVSYYPDVKNPWSYVWFGFEGSLSQMVTEVGFNEDAPLFRMPKPKEITDLISTMVHRVKGDSLSEYLFVKSVFLRLISDIAAKKETEKPPNIPNAEQSVTASPAPAPVPMMLGEASGLARALWITQPETAREAPQTSVAYSLGRRTRYRIRPATLSFPSKSP